MNDVATAGPPARSNYKKLKDCTSLSEAFETAELREKLAAAVPSFINPAAMLRTWQQAAAKSPNIYKAPWKQALGAFQSLAYLGLMPNTHLNLAHIIPFRKMVWNPKSRKKDIETFELQVVIGYPGYIDLAHRSGAVRSVHCDVVFDPHAEQFEFEYGTNQHLRHGGQPPGFKPGAKPLYAYAWFGLAAGGDQFEVMPWHEVEKIRDGSQAYRNAIAAREEAASHNRRPPPTYTEAPWVKNPEEMGKKTALRRGQKWIPKSPELRAAAAIEDAQERGNIDWGSVIDGEASPFDGTLPEAEPDPEEGVDPGAAGSMQGDRPSARQPEDPADASLGEKVKPQAIEPETKPPQDRREPAPKIHDVPPLEFEAAIVDEYGEPASDIYADPIKFSAALVEHWRRMPDQSLTEALLEFNADALATIDGIGGAASVAISAIKPPEEASANEMPDDPPYKPTAIAVGTGDQRWPAYVRDVKEAIKAVPTNAMAASAWALAQEPGLKMAPTAQRLLAVNAVAQMLGKAGVVDLPSWLTALVKPKREAAKAEEEKPKPEASKAINPDEKLLAGYRDTLSGFEAISPPATALAEFNSYTKSAAIQAQMSTLKQRNPTIFTKAEKLFNETYVRLTAAAEGRP